MVTSSAPNQFLARASGGVQFYTNGTLSSGLQLAGGGSQWLGVSDANMKHPFSELDGEVVLARLSRMPVMEWSYKAQDAAIRHAGPTAQDFSAPSGWAKTRCASAPWMPTESPWPPSRRSKLAPVSSKTRTRRSATRWRRYARS